jgi:hypothetical protein
VPERLELLLDGVAGASWELYVNGARVTAAPERSRIDSQMQAVPIAARRGTNVIALRLELRGSTDGLLDLVKLIGDFAVRDGVIVAPERAAACADWTAQGHPYFSGCGVYRTTARLAPGASAWVLEADAGDDVLEVAVNGAVAGVRLWPPYAVDVTDLLTDGDNELELRVCNTPVNLLEGTPRRSGLAGPPRLVPYARFELPLPS